MVPQVVAQGTGHLGLFHQGAVPVLLELEAVGQKFRPVPLVYRLHRHFEQPVVPAVGVPQPYKTAAAADQLHHLGVSAAAKGHIPIVEKEQQPQIDQPRNIK